jgi:hypothetical protein
VISSFLHSAFYEQLSGLFNNLFSDLIVVIIASFAWPFLRKHARKRSWLRCLWLSILLISVIIAFTISLIIICKLNLQFYWLISIVIVFICLLLILVFAQVGQTWRVGIIGADYSVQKGINYTEALGMCRDNLRFMGLGASKLVAEPGFANCLVRCTHETPIQLLLFKPLSSLLVDAARRADHDRDKFKERVLSSLKQIALLKQQRALNIEVRFYDHAPLFRLMFIDDTFCLLSYYVMGEGDGSQLPQVHLLKRPFMSRSVNSLYFAFEVLYNRDWNEATPWDFKEFI